MPATQQIERDSGNKEQPVPQQGISDDRRIACAAKRVQEDDWEAQGIVSPTIGLNELLENLSISRVEPGIEVTGLIDKVDLQYRPSRDRR